MLINKSILNSVMVRVTILLMISTSLVLTASGIYRYVTNANEQERQLRKELASLGKNLSTSLATPVYNFANTTIESICRATLRQKNIVGIGLSLEGNQTINFIKQKNKIIPYKHLPDDADYIVSNTPIIYNNTKLGILHIVMTKQYLLHALWSDAKFKIITLVVLEACLMFFLVVIIEIYIAHPLQQMATVSKSIADGNLETPVGIPNTTEFAILAKSLNVLQTNIKEQIDKLKKSEENYREIFNAGSYAVIIHDVENGIILDVNNPAIKMSGYKKEEIVGQTIDIISAGVTPYDKENAIKWIKKACEEGPQTFEWKMKPKDGNITWVEVSLKFVKIGGNEVILAVSRNIEEKKRAQELLIQSEKMMSVGGLAAGMAHEINNPLAGMMHTASVMKDRLGDLDIPGNIIAAEKSNISLAGLKSYMERRDIFKMLDRINNSGVRAAEIVKNMLSFVQKGKGTHSTHCMTELIDECVELASIDYDLKKKYDFKQIEIIREFPSESIYVPCDAGKIQQVLMNILRNGAEAMLEKSNKLGDNYQQRFILRLFARPEINMMQIEIEDNGPGMSEDVRKRVFEPFFTTKTTGKGTGLGLSVSYFIIADNHHGEMEVDSSFNEGTRFVIRLPYKNG